MALCHLKANDARQTVAECTALLHAGLDAPAPPAPSELSGPVAARCHLRCPPAVAYGALVLRARALRRGGLPRAALVDLAVADKLKARGMADGASAAVATELRAVIERELAQPGGGATGSGVGGPPAPTTRSPLSDGDLPPALPVSFLADLDATHATARARARATALARARAMPPFGGAVLGGDSPFGLPVDTIGKLLAPGSSFSTVALSTWPATI